MPSPRPTRTLKAKALACIAQREHSRVELRRKLKAHAARCAAVGDAADEPSADAEIDALLDWLAAKDLLSEARFVESRVHVRAGRLGGLRIRHELAQHGIALDAETQASLDRSELARARAVWVKRFGPSPAADAAGRAKQMRFLAARGFSAEVARQVLKVSDD